MLRAGDEIALTPGKAVAGGWMLGRHEGQVVLASGAIPGEPARVRIDRATRDVAYAHLVEALEPHADRRAPSIRSPCGGNAYAHIGYRRQLQLKSEVVGDALRRIGRIDLESAVPVAPSPERGYRMRARLHVGPDGLGFYREGTHEVCDPRETGQLLDETAVVLGQLWEALRRSGSTGVAAVELAENRPATERAVHLEAHELAAGLRAITVDGVSGLTASRMDGQGVATLYGYPYVTDEIEIAARGERVATASLRRGARAFFQGNRYLLSTLVDRVVEWTPAGAVTDLYAGVGLFAVACAAAGRGPVTAVEGDLVSAAALEVNAVPFGGALAPMQMTVEEFVRRRSPLPATVVVDPPRTGLSRDVRDALASAAPRRLLYVSCDAATLGRDLRALVEGGYRLEHIEAFDLFPNTAHVEMLVVLDRRAA